MAQKIRWPWFDFGSGHYYFVISLSLNVKDKVHSMLLLFPAQGHGVNREICWEPSHVLRSDVLPAATIDNGYYINCSFSLTEPLRGSPSWDSDRDLRKRMPTHRIMLSMDHTGANRKVFKGSVWKRLNQTLTRLVSVYPELPIRLFFLQLNLLVLLFPAQGHGVNREICWEPSHILRSDVLPATNIDNGYSINCSFD